MQDLEVCLKHIKEACARSMFLALLWSPNNHHGNREYNSNFCATFFTTILKSKVAAAQVLNDNMAEEKSNYIQLLEEERDASLQNKARVTASFFLFLFLLVLMPLWDNEVAQSSTFSQNFDTLQCFHITDRKAREIERELKAESKKDSGSTCQGMKKGVLQRSIKLSRLLLRQSVAFFLQSAILLDEAKIREDARSVQYKSLEKGHAVLKEENKTVRFKCFNGHRALQAHIWITGVHFMLMMHFIYIALF